MRKNIDNEACYLFNINNKSLDIVSHTCLIKIFRQYLTMRILLLYMIFYVIILFEVDLGYSGKFEKVKDF